MKKNPIVLMLAFVFCMPAFGNQSSNEQWENLAARFLDEMPALSPVGATSMGDHRFDGELDEVSADARRSEAGFIRRYQAEMASIDREQLDRAHQVDFTLLEHELASSLWTLEELQPWAWNPLTYTQLAGGAIYSLMARKTALYTSLNAYRTMVITLCVVAPKFFSIWILNTFDFTTIVMTLITSIQYYSFFTNRT